ncbi:MAG TPA: ABC transporter ATP-binding protein [Gaiellaceae bacterium]|jgi:branched-chain amino acid transport system ATP-binding protein|nr:ABC transporter ATP-binding protein [Gaiellaceae bacterium]
MTASAQPEAAAAPALRLLGVNKRFGGVHAVRDVDLEVAAGERRAILGPNGAGKTTLFNLVAGDFPPTSGTIEVLGEDVTRQPARRRTKLGLARTYQKSRLFHGLTVEDNLYLAVVGREGGRLRPVPTRRDGEFRERARAAAERVWLGDQLRTAVGSLSHGEQRQLEVGLASVTEPQVMMLDEPASGLSRGERGRLTELLLGLAGEVTLILIEHDMDVALTVAERVTMMHDGRVIVEGTPAEIRANELVHDLYLGRAHGHE